MLEKALRPDSNTGSVSWEATNMCSTGIHVSCSPSVWAMEEELHLKVTASTATSTTFTQTPVHRVMALRSWHWKLATVSVSRMNRASQSEMALSRKSSARRKYSPYKRGPLCRSASELFLPVMLPTVRLTKGLFHCVPKIRFSLAA